MVHQQNATSFMRGVVSATEKIKRDSLISMAGSFAGGNALQENSGCLEENNSQIVKKRPNSLGL